MLKVNNKNTRKRCEICPGRNYLGKNVWGGEGGISWGDFQVGGNYPEGNYLGILVQGLVVLGEFHRGQLSERQLPRGNIQG